jgi:hypothetical protein
VQDGLGMESRCPRAQNFDEPSAEAGATARRCDHQHALQWEPRRFIANARDRARREYDALTRDIVNEGCDHPTRRSPHRPAPRR